jgi:DNA-binding beta-propeller fold protein YncE
MGTDTIIVNVNVGNSLRGVSNIPDGKTVYVANSGSQNVSQSKI